MSYLGLHLLFDFYQCNPATLNHRDRIRDILLEASSRAKANLIKESFHQFEPQGVSGFLLISESHLAIHTWPEKQFAALDLFTCNQDLNIEEMESFLMQALGAKCVEKREIKRGDFPKISPDSLFNTQFA